MSEVFDHFNRELASLEFECYFCVVMKREYVPNLVNMFFPCSREHDKTCLDLKTETAFSP